MASAFLLYLNDGWTEEDGGLFTDEEDAGHPHYTPGWNTLLTFRVPRWHLVTPVRAHRTRWSIYGWSLDAQPSEWEQFVTFVTTKPLHVLGIILAIIGNRESEVGGEGKRGGRGWSLLAGVGEQWQEEFSGRRENKQRTRTRTRTRTSTQTHSLTHQHTMAGAFVLLHKIAPDPPAKKD